MMCHKLALLPTIKLVSRRNDVWARKEGKQ